MSDSDFITRAGHLAPAEAMTVVAQVADGWLRGSGGRGPARGQLKTGAGVLRGTIVPVLRGPGERGRTRDLHPLGGTIGGLTFLSEWSHCT
jgi:hypothetical protein